MTHQINRTYQGLDLIKFLMAICVVMIHVKAFNPDWETGSAINYIISLAVPFFFIASGFLLAYKVDRENTTAVISKYNSRIWRMYFTWILIYVPLCIWGFYIKPSEPSIGKFVFVQLRSVFLFGEIRFSYPTWYLFSLAIATTLIRIMGVRRIFIILLFLIGLGGILLHYLIGVIDMQSKMSALLQALSRMTIGLGYVIPGIYIYKKNHSGVCISLIISILLVSLVLWYLGLPFHETLGAFALFCFALNLPPMLTKKLSQWFRLQSLWIYLSHMYVLTPICLLGLITNKWMIFFSTLFICIILSQILITLSKSQYGAFLKKLI